MVEIEELAVCPLFDRLSAESLARLQSLLTVRAFQANEVLVHEGEEGDRAYAILTGRLAISHGGVQVGELGPGTAVGEMYLFEHQPRSATIRALTAGRLVGVTGDDLRRLRKLDPGAFVRLLVNCTRDLTDRLRDLNHRYAELVHRSGMNS